MEKDKEKDEVSPPEKDTGIRNMLVDFASATTAHGISRFVTSGPIYARFTWFLIWVAVMIGFFFMIAQLVQLYNSEPVSTSISVSYEESLTFPGIKICNLNVFPKSSMNAVKVQNGNKKDFENTYKNNFASESSFNATELELDNVPSVQRKTFSAINNLPLVHRLNNGFQFSDLVTYCSWAGFSCNKGVFEKIYWERDWNWKYGNCFSFNGRTKSTTGNSIRPLTTTSAGLSGGLVLNLDIQSSDYLDGVTIEKGVRVLIQDQDVFAEPSDYGFNIASGASVSIALKKEVIEREDVSENGSCRQKNRFDAKYFQTGCISLCKGQMQKTKCNCTSLQYKNLIMSEECDSFEEETCLLLVNSNFSKGIYDCSKECPPSCSQVAFLKTIATSKIYPKGYLAVYNVKNQSTNYVLNNLIHLEIYFADQTVTTISTKKYYQFKNLISDVGGQLGLWIGVSAVTCVEFFALVWSIIVHCFCRRGKNRVTNASA